MITILHVESSLGWGGQEMRTMRELTHLSPEFRPLLAAQPESVIIRKAREAGIRAFDVKMRGSLDLLAAARLARLASAERADVVHSHSSIDSWVAWLATLLCSRKVRLVRTRHLGHKIRNILIYRFAHKIVAVGESTRRYLVEEKKIPPDRVEVHHTGIDLDRFDPGLDGVAFRREFNIPPDSPVVGTVSVIRGKKGHRFLIDAVPEILKKYPRLKTIVVGNGPMKVDLEAQIEKMGLKDSVILAGHREDVPGALAAMDLFAFPSTEEALGTAVLEAMAMKRPVVASNAGGLPEVVRPGENGTLVPPRDPRALAQAIVELLGDPARRRRMGEKGRALVEAEFSNARMIEKVENLYRELA